MQRHAYLGLNQIGVYGTAAMTDLTAELNVKSLVDCGLKEDETSPGKKIEVDGEQISIQPELATDDDDRPFEVRDGKLVFTVKSIPGLKYQVLASDSLDPGSFAPAGQTREATGTRRKLTVTRSGETKGFYKIHVSR